MLHEYVIFYNNEEMNLWEKGVYGRIVLLNDKLIWSQRIFLMRISLGEKPDEWSFVPHIECTRIELSL